MRAQVSAGSRANGQLTHEPMHWRHSDAREHRAIAKHNARNLAASRVQWAALLAARLQV